MPRQRLCSSTAVTCHNRIQMALFDIHFINLNFIETVGNSTSQEEAVYEPYSDFADAMLKSKLSCFRFPIARSPIREVTAQIRLVL